MSVLIQFLLPAVFFFLTTILINSNWFNRLENDFVMAVVSNRVLIYIDLSNDSAG